MPGMTVSKTSILNTASWNVAGSLSSMLSTTLGILECNFSHKKIPLYPTTEDMATEFDIPEPSRFGFWLDAAGSYS